MVRTSFLWAVLALFVSGCQVTTQGAGEGPISLTSNVEARFQGYLANPGGEYFAVSTDGRNYGYSVCASGRFECAESGGSVALRSCRARSDGAPCKIYAVGENIVWQGVTRDPKTTKVAIEVGRGAITLTPRAQKYFDEYLSFPHPEYFAVSSDGNYLGYSFCRNPPCLSPGLKEMAVSMCVRDIGRNECYIYAVGRKVVWAK